MSKVIVKVSNYKDLDLLREYSKHTRVNDIIYMQNVVNEDFKKGNRENKDVFCLYTNDGYFEDVSSFHIFLDTYPLIEISEEMFNA